METFQQSNVLNETNWTLQQLNYYDVTKLALQYFRDLIIKNAIFRLVLSDDSVLNIEIAIAN